MKAKLNQKKEVAEGTLELVFNLDEKIEFQAGQYFFLKLDKKIDDPRGNQRHFTIVNPPEENKIIKMVTRLTGSDFKEALKKLEPNEQVEIFNIGGSFTLSKDEKQPLIFIAGGIGITPFISIIEHIDNNNLDYQVHLIYSNHNKDSTIYFDKLKKLDKKLDQLKVSFTMTSSDSWQGETRRIDKKFIKDYLSKPNNYKYMVAGPPGMVGAVEEELEKAGVEEEGIKSENFTGYEKYN